MPLQDYKGFGKRCLVSSSSSSSSCENTAFQTSFLVQGSEYLLGIFNYFRGKEIYS
jgi:hypothetical protein